ncbi:MAG: tetratricopeptide repeat protein [Phycisphaerae bacterium]|nr:tetratricopeptide repeat protein [Phycisphaerae bacterium]
MKKKRNILIGLILILSVGQFAPCSGVYGGQRRIGIGEKVPEFSAQDVTGQTFDYKHGGGKVLMVVFLSGRQKGSARAAGDIERIIRKLDANSKRLDIAFAVDDPNTGAIFQNKEKDSGPGLYILPDTEYKLWGKFGIIVTPTVIISDTNDTVLWVQPGHGPDFAPVVQARLNQAMGISQEVDPNEAGQVKTVKNTTVEARIKRHVQMAKLLQKKGKLEPAIKELRRAMVMDPNSLEVLFELGELFCTAGRNQAAVDLIKGVKVTKRFEKARALLITGWAKRQMGELDTAEELLLETIKLDSKSIRGFFELGKIYQTKGDVEKAMQAYRRALSVVFEEPVIKAVSH